MLSLYHAADLESLTELAMGILKIPRANPLAAEHIIVPSQGMGRWLTLELAKRQGIAMHLEMQLPSSFIWNMSRGILGTLPEQSAFQPANLAWRLYDWLCEPENLEQVPALKAYLTSCDERRRLSLAAKIADVFDQYLLYRDDWLAAWEKSQLLNLGPDEGWQAKLWQMLTQNGHPHRARVLDIVQEKLHDPSCSIPNLPERILVFGISSLPNHYLRVLHALSHHVEIAVFALNPSKEAWGDIQDLRQQARNSPLYFLNNTDDLDPDAWYLHEMGHPLLAALGKQGKDFFNSLFSMIADESCTELGVYADPEAEALEQPDSDAVKNPKLLKTLQNDILCLKTRTKAERIVLSPEDRSLEVHVCHSALREVEVLHDQLLARFAADPELTPDQVVVLTPDIERYSPFIEAVFRGKEGQDKTAEKPRIPYSLADRGLRTEIPLIESFLQLLALPESRFTAEEVLTWLHQPAIAAKAGIEEDDLPLIRHWLTEANVRWGMNAQHKAQLHLPEQTAFSWQQGLDRLLLGFAAPPQLSTQTAPLLDNLFPIDAVEGSNALLLGRLQLFTHQLHQLTLSLSKARPLADWANSLQGLLEELFDEQEAGETLLLLSKSCAALREQAEISQLTRDIPLDLVRQQLTHALECSNSTTGFLTGMVTFCTMVPMRSLPFKVICLLGLNDGEFPRRTAAPGFDLIAQRPRSGDRTRRLDDRYLLLEAIMAAKQHLYLSYVGRGVRDNALLPPSVLISELLESIDLTATAPNSETGKASEAITIFHTLQPFSPENFAQRSESSKQQGFSPSWFEAASALTAPHEPPKPFAQGQILAVKEQSLSPQQFVHWAQHPSRFFLRQLGLALPEQQLSIDPNEPFEVERSAQRNLQKLCLEAIEHAWSLEDELKMAQSAGWIPTGTLGEAHWKTIRAAVAAFSPRLLQERPKDPSTPIKIDLKIDNLHLYGWLEGVTDKGLFTWRLEAPTDWDKTAFWIRHLLLNWAQPEAINCSSRLLSPEEDWQLDPLDPKAAEELLVPWLKACQESFLGPVPLLPRSGYAYVQTLLKGKADPLEAAQKQWQGNGDYQRGECQDPWNALAFRNQNPVENPQFSELAIQLLAPIQEHLKTQDPVI